MNDVIDTLELKIVVNSNNGAQTLRDTANAVKKLSNNLQSADFSKLGDLGKRLQNFSSVLTDLDRRTKGLGTVASRIKSLNKGISELDTTSIGTKMSELAQLFSTFNSAVGGLDNIKGISGLNTRLKTLNKNLTEINTSVFKSKFAEMTEAITPFINKVNSAQASLEALNGVIGGAKTLTNSNPKPKSTGKVDKALNIGSIVGKLYFVKNVTQRLGQGMAKLVQYGIDYQETLNLWQTAMGNNISQARTFVSEMNKAYGISSATLMNYQAVFKNMLSALGNISDATAYGLSESLTQMALDFASLYNVSVESAMTKFQAVLSGQVRPIRTAGYDITENTIFQLYQSLGGTKTVRQLNQTEKQLLRILAVFEQMKRSGATGDLKKTLGSSANQLRMMKEQGKEFATWIGISFQTLMEKSHILVGINTALYVATELARSFAYSLGYAEPDWGIDFSKGVGDANKEVDELKGKLLGFDKFNVLQSSAGEESIGIEDTLVKALEEYQTIFKSVDNPAVSTATKILEAFGGKLVDVKNEAGEVVGKIWEFPPAVEDVARAIGSLATSMAIIAGIAIEKKLFEAVTGMLGLGNASTGLAIGGLALVIYGVTTLLTKWDEMTVMARVLTIALTALGVVIALPSLRTGLFNLIGYGNGLAAVTAKTKLLQAASFACFVFGIYFLLDGLNSLSNWGDMTGMERATAVLKTLAGVAFLAAAAFAVMHTSWSMGAAAAALGIAIPTAIASIAMAQASAKDIEKGITMKAGGGLATKGSLFYAGEAGPELVTQTSGGNSTIMNMKQLEDAVARGFIRGFASTDRGYEDDNITDVYVDGQRLFNIMRGTAKRNGYDFVKV